MIHLRIDIDAAATTAAVACLFSSKFLTNAVHVASPPSLKVGDANAAETATFAEHEQALHIGGPVPAAAAMGNTGIACCHCHWFSNACRDGVAWRNKERTAEGRMVSRLF